MNKNTSYFIAISNAVRNNWINKGIDSSKIRTIYNGIKLDDIVQKEYNHLSNKDNKFRIVFSGAITNNKGQIHLINALNLLDDKMMKNIYVDFIGNYDFKYYEYLMTIVKKNHYSNNINFLGYCKNIRKEICKYDVGICCSKSEAFGRVTVEYMAAGIPVIGSNTGSNLELITNSVGYLYDYNNDDSLTEVISYCYNNRNELQKKGIQAKSTVYNKYNTKINVKNIFELYCSI
jgi:glycosyltransferase involved in cell wall biosynthesis